MAASFSGAAERLPNRTGGEPRLHTEGVSAASADTSFDVPRLHTPRLTLEVLSHISPSCL